MSGGLTRRELLGAGAAAVAAVGVADSLRLPSSPRPAAASRVPAPGRLQDIDHVVVVIQENRSFDHYFGTFPGVRGFADPLGRSVFAQHGDVPGGVLLPWHLTGDAGPRCMPDIAHRWVPQHACWNGGRMDRFLAEHLRVDGRRAAPEAMGFYDRGDLAYYFALAGAFTICDRHHSSVLGPTDPNLLHALSGTLDPDGAHGGPILSTRSRTMPLARLTWTTMPEQLSARGVSWTIYAATDRVQLRQLLASFPQLRGDRTLRRRALEPTFPHDFVADVRAGELPQVSWVFASLAESDHPQVSAATAGEDAVRRVVSELTARRSLWTRTAAFVTWDENGGFFDHVAPPTPEPGTPGEFVSGQLPREAGGVDGPVGLGFRVPLLVVSPFSRGGLVCSDVSDHTSILRFLETRFGAEVPNLSAWRRAVTSDLTGAFDFAHPDASVPRLSADDVAPAAADAAACRRAVEHLRRHDPMPGQEPGGPRRPSGPV